MDNLSHNNRLEPAPMSKSPMVSYRLPVTPGRGKKVGHGQRRNTDCSLLDFGSLVQEIGCVYLGILCKLEHQHRWPVTNSLAGPTGGADPAAWAVRYGENLPQFTKADLRVALMDC